ELVRRSLALVIDRDLLASADRYGSPQYGSHLERYLVDAMRRLAAGHSAWAVNRDKARLWFGEDGLFLAWPEAAKDILELLEGDQLAGIPKAPDTLLDILLDAGVLTAPAEGSRNWAIFPTGAEKPIAAVRLASPAIVLAGNGTLPAPLNRSMQRSDTIPSPRATVKTPPVPASHPAPPIAKPAQLSLIEADPNPVPATIAPADDAPKSDSPPPPVAAQDPAPAQRVQPICLKAPMRLNPAVRQALVEAVETLNDPPATTSVFTQREGIFIPLAEFERRGIQATVALRALADADMLYSPRKNGPPTATRDVQGVATVGIVLLPRHVDGLDPLAFAPGADAAT
ncbi:MAG TPA: TraI domain-containing protein, partial [Burkholderiaceae bacterium]|nr:TraI domain-containing protein [Burkholderiaceae bacterium]